MSRLTETLRSSIIDKTSLSGVITKSIGKSRYVVLSDTGEKMICRNESGATVAVGDCVAVQKAGGKVSTITRVSARGAGAKTIYV